MGADDQATPEEEADERDGLLDVLTPESEGDEQGTEADEASLALVEEEIDELLLQMTACWATGEPERWLPLLSDGFRDSLISTSDDFYETLQAAMASPIVWERAGDLDIDSDSEVSALVRSTVGQEDDFQRFSFVLEDDEWRWNG